ncbi:MAG: GrpB family protein [Blautia sp.]|nr:GrpB family protein [Blautia sp.]
MELGVVNGTVRLAEHDPAWAEEAARMIAHLQEILRDPDILEYQHVGSTAIRGILAKPIVDIAAAIRDYSVVERWRDRLEAEGFQYLGKVTDDDWMYHIGHPGRNDRTHHLHFVTAGSARWIKYVSFRDYLNAVPAAAERYGNLKRSLAETLAGERKQYHAAKVSLIDELEAEAFAWWEAGGKDGRYAG